MIRLRRVHLRRFRGLAPDTVLEFGPDEVFLLGKNGTGKSTLLRLLSALAHADPSALLAMDDAIDVEWWMVSDAEASDMASIDFRARFSASAAPEPFDGLAALDAEIRRALIGGGARGAADAQWQLELELSPTGDPTPVIKARFSSEGVAEVHPEVSPSRIRALRRIGLSPERNILRRLSVELARLWLVGRDAPGEPPPNSSALQSALRSLWTVTRERPRPYGVDLDGALQAYEDVLEWGELRQVTVKEDGLEQTRPLVATFVPRPVVDAWDALLSGKTQGPGLPLDRALAAALGAEAIEFVPRLAEQTSDGARKWRGFDLLVTWPDGSRHRHHQLSFGQKRFIAHHWVAALEPELPFFADELTNGLHADWVEQIAEQLEGRQSFHALQNPLLLDLLGPREVGAIQHGLVLCEVALDGRRRVWTWRNPTAEEAASVQRSRDAGFQKLSEVLRSRGLW